MLSYGSDFSVWFDSIFLAFRVGDKSYSVSTSEHVFHVVFTLSTVNGSRCYINGKHWTSDPFSVPPSPGERGLSIAIREDFKLTELFLWSSEMTPEQVLEEYEGRNFMFFIASSAGISNGIKNFNIRLGLAVYPRGLCFFIYLSHFVGGFFCYPCEKFVTDLQISCNN